jgi:hypothetical protein
VLLEKNNDYFVTFFTNLIATRYSLLTIQMLNETNDRWLTIVTNGNEIRISAHLCSVYSIVLYIIAQVVRLGTVKFSSYVLYGQ